METLRDLALAHAYIGLFVVSVIEGTALPFPGRVVLITAGTLAASGALDLVAVIVVSAAGALAGDHVWYVAGRLRGEGILELYCRALPARRRCVERAREYLGRFGAASFLVGRFVAGVRILVAPVAASAGIGYVRFLVFDGIGALAWAATFVLLGYGVGTQWPTVLERFGIVGSVAVSVALTVAGLVIVWVWRRLSRSPRGAPRPARDRRRRPAA
jgi:membrane protein DedA with SNARE-associated domain